MNKLVPSACLHPAPGRKEAHYMVLLHDGHTYIDPQRAHEAAGDPGYERAIEGCARCIQQAEIEQAAEDAAAEA